MIGFRTDKLILAVMVRPMKIVFLGVKIMF